MWRKANERSGRLASPALAPGRRETHSDLKPPSSLGLVVRTMRPRYFITLLCFLALLNIPSASARTEPPKPRKIEPPPKTNDIKKADAESKPEPIKPYGKVITKEAKSERGRFWVHRVEDKFYFEIPTNEFGKEFLWVTQIERTQSGFGYGGTPVGNRVVRWELRDKDVLLRDVKYTIRADGSDSVRRSVEATSLAPIIRKFPVAAWGTNKAAVVEVTEFFTTDVSEFSAKNRLNASGVDKARSF